jgi:hypothetical protein
VGHPPYLFHPSASFPDFKLGLHTAKKYNRSMDIKDMHVAIATPCYGGLVCQNYLMSMLTLNSDAIAKGLKISYIIRGGDSLIPRTRNSIVAEFLSKEEFTHLLWVDADIGFDTAQIMRLLTSPHDVACGVYPLKKLMWPDKMPRDMTADEYHAEYTRYPFNPVSNTRVGEDGFIEVLDAPTGLMCIKREVLEKMKKAYPGLRFLSDEMLGLEHLRDDIENNHYRFFDVMTEENGRYLSEDYAFCRRWQNIGGKVHADCMSNLTHQGTHIYRGNFSASLRAMHDRNTQAAVEAQKEADQ